jgi:hypothetical protein
MSEQMDHLSIPWETIVGFILSAAFASWAWVVKSFGEQHIASVKELGNELKELRKDVNVVMNRVTRLEVEMDK